MIGKVLDGRYRIVRKLGEGGMGGVWEAQHTSTGRRVAVKVIVKAHAADAAMIERFKREALAAGGIDSEHVAHVLDFGTDEATANAYLAMEYLEGEDLSKLSARLGPMHPDLALRIIAQVCTGLQKAHDTGIVHRDIKSANVFATHRDEGAVTIKLLDFGVAKLKSTEGAPVETLTKTGGMIGTPHYMSPEQARGAKDVDQRTDIWSVGVVMYRLLTGTVPNQDAQSVGELIYQLVTTQVTPVQDVAPWVPAQVAAIAHKALRTDPALRYQTAAEMLDAIKELLPDGRAIRIEMLVSLPEELRTHVATRAVDPLTEASAADRARARADAARARTVTEVVGSVPPERAAVAISPTGPTKAAWDNGPVTEHAAEGRTATPAPKRRPFAAYAGIAVAVVALGSFAAWRSTKAPDAGAGASNVPSASASASSSAAASASAPSNVIDDGRLESFGPLPAIVTTHDNPLSDAKVALGRMLFHDPRLSKEKDVSCASCHVLDSYGVDGKQVSTGHAQQVGTRNSPSVYNSAGYFALMWDGRAANVEDQAKLPLLNPVEMAMTPKLVVERLRAVAAYVTAFAASFPDDKPPLTFDNAARAIAAFERKLFTPSRWEAYLAGDKSALTDDEKIGFNTFVEVGCPTCHFGPYVGATMFQKLGLVKPWPYTRDRGRYELTQKNEDYMLFRVPSLRNVAKTAPYFHDGSRTSLDEVVRMMARHQIGKEISDAQIAAIVAWLGSLTGGIPTAYIKKPDLP
jgi:cytochrome c peroxidase